MLSADDRAVEAEGAAQDHCAPGFGRGSCSPVMSLKFRSRADSPCSAEEEAHAEAMLQSSCTPKQMYVVGSVCTHASGPFASYRIDWREHVCLGD